MIDVEQKAGEDESDAPIHELQPDKQEEDWAPNASMEVRVGTPQSLQKSEDLCPSDGPQMSTVEPRSGVTSTDPGLDESFSQSEDFDDNESGVAPLNVASDEVCDDVIVCCESS